MNTELVVLLLIFLKIFFYFGVITLMENVNNFELAKVHPQGVA